MNQIQKTSVAFFIFSILLFLIFLLLKRNTKKTILPKRFFLLSWGVYVSGTLLILILSFIRSEIKLSAILICESLILLIGGGSAALMYALSKGLKSVSEAAMQSKETDETK